MKIKMVVFSTIAYLSIKWLNVRQSELKIDEVKVTFYFSGNDKVYQFKICKPTVCQQIIETDSVSDCCANHCDERICLFFKIFIYTNLCD